MPKEASTTERNVEILTQLSSANCTVYRKVEYYDDITGGWKNITGITGTLKTSKKSVRRKYVNNQLIPLASTCSFDIINTDGKYSPDSGTEYADIFVKNRKVRIWFGYRLENLGDEVSESVLFNSEIYNYFTKLENSSFVVDVENSEGGTNEYLPSIFDNLYNSGLYGGDNYSPAGYMIVTIDRLSRYFDVVNSYSITMNGTGASFYHRYGNDTGVMQLESYAWTYDGVSSNGTETFDIDVSDSRYIQIAIVYDVNSWSSSLAVTDLSIAYQSYIEWFKDGVYYLDDPQFVEPSSEEMPTVECDGRDAWKKAIETDINISDLSGGVPLDQLIKDVCDIVNINYTVDSICDLSAFSDRTLADGFDSEITCDELFEMIMQIIGTGYIMWIDENDYLYVQPKSASVEFDYVFNYLYYTRAKKSFDSSRQLQRLTVLSEDTTVDAETLLDSDTFSTTGQKTFSWSGDAIYKRIATTLNSGTMPTIVLDYFENESAAVTITATESFNITMYIYGDIISVTPPDAIGEAGVYDNIVNKEGSTSRITNPLIIDDSEAKTIAEDFISFFGDPSFTISLDYPYLYALSIINDKALVWGKYNFESSIYYVTGISHTYADETNATTAFELEDSGINYLDSGYFIYDRNGLQDGDLDVYYNIGALYDMDIKIGTSDSNDYSGTKEVEFS